MRTSLLATVALTTTLWAGSAAAQALRAGERAADITAIAGVVDAGSSWELVWSGTQSADGLVPSADGGLLFAQEQTDTVRKLDSQHREYILLRDTHGTGAVSMDAQGRLFGVQRRLLDSFPDGKPLGRVNDLVADGKGGAYFTSGGAWHVTAQGALQVVAEDDIRANGILLSGDGRLLWVTNNDHVLAFTVQPDGSVKSRRTFGALGGDTGGDGMALDNDGRLYVTASKGVHVLSRDGGYLGLIPTPRPPISLAFTGPGKKLLYVAMMGAVGPDGKPWTTPPGVRNVGMSIYRLPVRSAGFAGRPK